MGLFAVVSRLVEVESCRCLLMAGIVIDWVAFLSWSGVKLVEVIKNVSDVSIFCRFLSIPYGIGVPA